MPTRRMIAMVGRLAISQQFSNIQQLELGIFFYFHQAIKFYGTSKFGLSSVSLNTLFSLG